MLRVIDCNINRVSEGFRVLEDISRFYLESEYLSARLKDSRQVLRKVCEDIDLKLLENRDSAGDIGPRVTSKIVDRRTKSKRALILGNFKRVQEGLRSLEEQFKTSDFIEKYETIEVLRYESYQLEKEYLGLFNRREFSLPELYGITHSPKSLGRSNIEIVKEMIKGGIKLIQYREKSLSLKEMLKECQTIRDLTKEAGVTFIVNDYIDIAIIVDADGVHIGQDDLPIKEVRKLLGPNKIIGLSTHSPEQGGKAVEDGADYIGVGPIYSTQTKVNVCDPVGYEYLEWVVKNIKIPFVAIGGIKEHNLEEIAKRGAKSICLVTDITEDENIPNKIKRLLEIKEKTNEL